MSDTMAKFANAVTVIKEAVRSSTPEELGAMNDIMSNLSNHLSEMAGIVFVDFVRSIFDENIEISDDGNVKMFLTKEHPETDKKDKYVHVMFLSDNIYLVVKDVGEQWEEKLDISNPNVGKNEIKRWFYDAISKYWEPFVR